MLSSAGTRSTFESHVCIPSEGCECVWGVCYAEGFAAAAIKHPTRIINGPPAARYPTPSLLQLQLHLHLSLCGRASFPCPPWPAVIDFESFFNWQHSSRPGLCMDNQTAGGVAEWEGGGGMRAGLFVFAFDKLFACKVNEGPGQ